MQRFPEKGDEKQVDEGEADNRPDKNRPERGFFIFQGYHFGIGEPFGRCSAEKGFEQEIIKEEDAKKEPAKIIVWIAPELHIPVPCLETEIGDRENNQGINKKIKGAGAVSDCSHSAKIGSGEWSVVSFL